LPHDRTRVLLVEDDPLARQTETAILESFKAIVIAAETVVDGLMLAQESSPDVIFLDLQLPDGNGIDLLQQIQNSGVTSPIVMISGKAGIKDAVAAIQMGAIDFLVKPATIPDMEAALRRALDIHRLRSENQRLKTLAREPQSSFLGVSKAVRDLLLTAERIARSDMPMLIEGETGSGKQVLARHIVEHSGRENEPFVAINCAAVVPTLFESELFGHEKGSFTGANARRAGKLELVGKGTLFLDEVGELPVPVQAKLLTALEDRVFERVGGSRPLQFMGRIIAATNRDLDREIVNGNFRRDLYFRLRGLYMRIPPLRERPEDIPVYVARALEESSRRHGRHYLPPSPKVLSDLVTYPWPGNVRELQFHVERAALLSDGAEISRALWMSGLGAALQAETSSTGEVDDLQTAVESFKRRHIQRILDLCKGNQTTAAERLGVGRSYLNRLIHEWQINTPR
jgi:DNA-binding NtrC family response regulator